MQRTQGLLVELQGIVGAASVQENAPMSHYTTLRLGGPADILCDINNPQQVPRVLATAKRYEVPVTLMGNGSNLLVLDGGLRGLVVRLGDGVSAVSDAIPLEDGRYALTAQAGASLARLAGVAATHALAGLEFAAGIPGTVGGAVYMNAGAYGGEMKDVVTRVEGFGMDGSPFSFTGEEMDFGYRKSRLSGGAPQAVVTTVTVALPKSDEAAIRQKMRELAAKRREKQPLGCPSCGSTFKRPQDGFAAALIEQCGLKGYRVGGACVSPLHAGFLLNDKDGTAADYLQLMWHVQHVVEEETGVKLEPEVRILGAAIDK